MSDAFLLPKGGRREFAEVQERKALSPARKIAIVESQGKRCAICKCKPAKFEFDHRDELWEAGDADPNSDNWQGLCPDCHATKTKNGTTRRAKMKRVRGLTGQRARREKNRPAMQVSRNGSLKVRR